MFRKFKGLFTLLAILCVSVVAGGSAYFYFGGEESKKESIDNNVEPSGDNNTSISADNILENYEFGKPDLNETYTYYFFPSTLYMELYKNGQNPETVFGYNEVVLDDSGDPAFTSDGQPMYNVVTENRVGKDGHTTYYEYLVNSLNNNSSYYLSNGDALFTYVDYRSRIVATEVNNSWTLNIIYDEASQSLEVTYDDGEHQFVGTLTDFVPAESEDSPEAPAYVGTWKGEVGPNNITLVLNDNDTGSYGDLIQTSDYSTGSRYYDGAGERGDDISYDGFLDTLADPYIINNAQAYESLLYNQYVGNENYFTTSTTAEGSDADPYNLTRHEYQNGKIVNGNVDKFAFSKSEEYLSPIYGDKNFGISRELTDGYKKNANMFASFYQKKNSNQSRLDSVSISDVSIDYAYGRWEVTHSGNFDAGELTNRTLSTYLNVFFGKDNLRDYIDFENSDSNSQNYIGAWSSPTQDTNLSLVLLNSYQGYVVDNSNYKSYYFEYRSNGNGSYIIDYGSGYDKVSGKFTITQGDPYGQMMQKAQYRNDRFGFWTPFYDWDDPKNKSPLNKTEYSASRYLPIKITVNGNLTPDDMAKIIPSVESSMFDSHLYFDFTANGWTYVKKSGNELKDEELEYQSAVGGFTAKDLKYIFDIMQHPSKYADSNNVIRLFPVFSNGKNYNSSLTDGGRDSLRADFKYKSNTSTITNSTNPTSTKLTYSSVTYYRSASGNDLSLPGYSYDVNYAVLNNVDLKKDKYDSITIKMAAAYGIHNWGEKWYDLYSISGSVINKFVDVFGEGLYTFYLFIGNSASHNGTQSNTTPFPAIHGDSLISYITNDLNYSSNELKFKHLNGIVDSSNNYNISATSSFYFFSSSEAGYGTIRANDRPIGLAVEKVTNLRLVTDIPIKEDDSGKPTGDQDWDAIDKNIQQGLNNAQNAIIADEVYEIDSYTNEISDTDLNEANRLDDDNPYIYLIQNADFRFVNNLYFQIRYSNDYISGGMNVRTVFPGEGADVPKYVAYKANGQIMKFFYQNSNEGIFIDNVGPIKGEGTVVGENDQEQKVDIERSGFKLTNYNARGIYDILLVSTGFNDETGTQNFDMYINRHKNNFIKLFKGNPKVFNYQFDIGETVENDTFVAHKLPNEVSDDETYQVRDKDSSLIWNGQTYLGEYLSTNTIGTGYGAKGSDGIETSIGKTSFIDSIKRTLGVKPGNDTIYPIIDAVTNKTIAYYNAGVGRLFTAYGSTSGLDDDSLDLFTTMKNYVLYIGDPIKSSL